jgi:hypothetical protein
MTSCSWERTGCRTSAFVKRTSPLRRFSRKLASEAIGVPLTKDSQHLSGEMVQNYLQATLFGGSRGSCRKGKRLCRQSSNQTKSLYRRTTLLARRLLPTS